ncbi:hypothetical protein TPHA_0G02170 [Tetrapisispora phaffii CBS 4417]|uniref:Uncharacterized protein n=1 Tax=Tetrapisispora phaffii (strain ATCC 24235 / CBS 4417 / NBRC 1672 / NRRL Y-8282 / UCD 70-5) TaxID=1071381 RepID=G8BVX5_TETPH|nr:hypothetical protein TPHA_0G02170 [Tetrapisispora phaffii CBS 4417]CCE64053.1 hypothetical protein TPHA_0G02170 [Tetrapisispora phaffii CBS 4417]
MLLLNFIYCIIIVLRISLGSDLPTVTTTALVKGVEVTNSAALAEAKTLAASADYEFILTFLENIDNELGSYKSYLDANKNTLPQKVLNYYYHLASIQSSINLTSDFANEFPFTVFQTFITQFPWYSLMLSEASISTFYLPEDFIAQASILTSTMDTGRSSIIMTNSSSSAIGTNSSTNAVATSIATSSTNSNTTSSTHSSSRNSANLMFNNIPFMLLAAVALIF